MMTNNPHELLVNIYDTNQWAKNLLALMKAENKALMTLQRFPDNEQYLKKYLKLNKIVDDYPPCPEVIEFEKVAN